MQEPNGLNDEQRELESALKSLAPAATGIDPIAAAFAAGRRSGGRQIRVWRSVAVLTLLIAGMGWVISVGHKAALPTREVTESAIALRNPQIPAEAPGPESLLALQEIVRAKGLDALPSANIPSVQVVNMGNQF